MKLAFVEASGFRGIRDRLRIELPTGFAILTGRNGVGKSTVLDAVDFAITGTINRFAVKEARGGGLDEHIWWVGSGQATEHYVSIGFVADDGAQFEFRRSREDPSDRTHHAVLQRLVREPSQLAVQTLIQTTLIRDELIAALSLDLPEQARFAAVRAALGAIAGPDHTKRTAALLSAAATLKASEEAAALRAREDLSRALSMLTEARSLAERSVDVGQALRIVESIPGALTADPAVRNELIIRWVARRKAALGEAEETVRRIRTVMAELKEMESAKGRVELETAEKAQEGAFQHRVRLEEQLASAERLEASERAGDEYAAHLAALLEHGTALGLRDGHCPLCDAARSGEEFKSAVAKASARLGARGKKVTAAVQSVARARAALAVAIQAAAGAESRVLELRKRRAALAEQADGLWESYRNLGVKLPSDSDHHAADALLLSEREQLAEVEHALFLLEASNAADKVAALEAQVGRLRGEIDKVVARVTDAERVVESVRQIDVSAKTVANELLGEQFDTVLPLLKELYRRLRPHPDWTEIDADFGGRVRASLNFLVGGGRNPQFLFSSGQRRAAGLAFLLSMHLSRPWCLWRTLLLDDPVQHIDDYRSINLAEVLSAVRRTGRQVIVAVEDSALADLLCRRLRGAPEDRGRRFELRVGDTGSVELANVEELSPLTRTALRPARAS